MAGVAGAGDSRANHTMWAFDPGARAGRGVGPDIGADNFHTLLSGRSRQG